MDFQQISQQVKKQEFAPVYYFYGQEPYFIDKLTSLLEKSVLEPHEEAFNKHVFYGIDTNAGKLLGELRAFPMMSTRRLIVLKEAQRMKKPEFEKLVPYLENPLQTTVFVINFKGKKLDGRTKASKTLKSKAVSFESKKLYENQVGSFIDRFVKSQGYTLDLRAQQVLVAYLGTNLSLIESEIEKIFLYLKDKNTKEISLETVYENINIDKDYNVFELIDTIGQRKHFKAHLIVNQMMKNVKDNPPIMIVYQLFSFFNKLSLLNSRKASSVNDIANILHTGNFIAKQYVGALKNYPQRLLRRNMVFILEADLYLKGIQPTHMNSEHILKTLVYKLLS